MKHYLLAVALICFGSSARAALGGVAGPDGVKPSTPYFETILKDPAHPRIGAGVLYTPAFEFDGAVTDVALVFHRANPDDTLWPKQLLDIGFPPISWTLLELGGGGNRESGFVHGGASVNLAPTVLGPLTKALEHAGGRYAAIGRLLEAPNGSGIRFGVGWKANVIRDGGIAPLNTMTLPPRYSVGYLFQF